MNRRVAWIVAALLAALAAAWAFDPTGVLPGWLGGEAFFESRPARHWRSALLGGPAAQADAVARLEAGGAAAAPVLIELLTSAPASDPEARARAAEILGKLGPDAHDAGAALLAGLDDADSHVQAVCAAALPRVGVAADAAVPRLTPLLSSEHAVVAARAISEYRGSAAVALPDLVLLLEDESRSVDARWNAARTIGKIGPAAVSALPRLIAALDSPEPTIREHSAEAIGDIGPTAAEEGVPALIRVLNDPAVRVRRDAVRSLGWIGEPARSALPEMRKLLDDPEELVRSAARTALQAVAPDEPLPDGSDATPLEAGDKPQPPTE